MSSCHYLINGEYKCKNIEAFISTVTVGQTFDDNKDCIINAFAGNCDSDKNWMNQNCPNTCKTVAFAKDKPNALDDKLCDYAASNNFCAKFPDRALMTCVNSCYNNGDLNEQCKGWADAGECANNPNYMLNYCKASCRCADKNINCAGWAKAGECKNNPNYMLNYCTKSCNSCPVKKYVY
jgi:hypothetical protein